MVSEAQLWRSELLLELGDIQATDAELEAWAPTAAQVRQPFYLYIASLHSATRAILVGQFEGGEQLAHQALTLGRRLCVESADGTFAVQMVTLRREQGRPHELAPTVRLFVQLHSTDSAWR